MAWTNPRDWATGELVVASYMNSDIRDNSRLSLGYLATTAGDTLYATAANATARLGIGTSGTILGSSGTAPQWVATTSITAVGLLPTLGVGTVSPWVSSGALSISSTDIFIGFRETDASTTDNADWRLRTITNNGFALDVVNNDNSISNPVFRVARSGTTVSSWTMYTHLLMSGDNTYDIGASGATRPRRIFVGTEVLAPAGTFSGDVTCDELDLTNAAGGIYGGPTALTLFSSGGTANVTVADAGNVTFRSGSVLSGITTVTATNLGGTLTTASQSNITILGAASVAFGGAITGVSTLGVTTVNATTALTVGTNPATTGAVRLANNNAIYWRNAANGANTAFIKQNNIDGLEIEAPASIVMRINSNNRFIFGDAVFKPETDNQASLGLVAQRWTAVYAVNGTIQTSHSSMKNFDRQVLPADALDVARQTARGSGFHRFTYKGNPENELRDYHHIGIKAEGAHNWLSPDGQTVNPQTTASIALAAVAGEADARDADIARLESELSDLRKLITSGRN